MKRTFENVRDFIKHHKKFNETQKRLGVSEKQTDYFITATFEKCFVLYSRSGRVKAVGFYEIVKNICVFHTFIVAPEENGFSCYIEMKKDAFKKFNDVRFVNSKADKVLKCLQY